MKSEDYKNAAELIGAIEKIVGFADESTLKLVRDALTKEVEHRAHISGPHVNHVIFYKDMLRFFNVRIEGK